MFTSGPTMWERLVRTLISNLKVMLLTPFGRSGSLLLQSLFDHHSEVSTFPAWIRWERFPEVIFDVDFSFQDFLRTNPGIFDLSKSYFGTTNTEINMPTGGSSIYYSLNRDLFRKNFEDLYTEFIEERGSSIAGRLHKGDFILLLHQALHVTLGRELNNLKLILIHVHFFSDSAKELSTIFPKSLYLVTIRDLREVWLSAINLNKLRLRLDSRYKPGIRDISDFTLIMRDRFRRMLEVMRLRPPESLNVFIDLNTFHAKGEEVLVILIDLLRLNWEDSLKTSSIYGHPWGGNIQNSSDFSFSVDRSKRMWKQKLSPAEVTYLEQQLDEELAFFGYRTQAVRNQLIKPKAASYGLLINDDGL